MDKIYIDAQLLKEEPGHWEGRGSGGEAHPVRKVILSLYTGTEITFHM